MRGPASASASTMARTLRMGTRSASNPCITRTTTASGSTFGTSSSTSFGAVFASAFSNCSASSWPKSSCACVWMRCDRCVAMTVARIDDGVTERLRVLAHRRLDPDGFHAEGRIACRDAIQRSEHAARIDRELAIGMHDAFADGHARQADAIGVGTELEVVADVHGLHEEAELLRELAADAADARQQIAALGAIDERHEAVTHFETDDVHRDARLPTTAPALPRVPAAAQARASAMRRGLLALLHQTPGRESAERRRSTGTRCWACPG